MLSFKKFILEKKSGDSKAGAVANANGVRHELLTAGVLSHMSKHHAGENHPNLFEMSDSELKDHFDNHVKNKSFSEQHMPEHFRDENNQTPRAVHDRYTHESLPEQDHFNHFKNAVRHAKLLHDHLEERGYDPKSIKNIAWTSVDGNVNSYMKKHGKNPDRKMNKLTDDPDLMTTIKHKQTGETVPLGLSLKWGSKKGAAPTAKNNTHKTVLTHDEFDPSVHEHIDDYLKTGSEAIKEHNKNVSGHYKGSEDARKAAFDADKKSLEKTPDNTEVKNKIQAVKDSYKVRNGKVADALHNTLKNIQNSSDGHKQIANFVRSKLNIPNPDFVAARAHMTVDKNNNADSHHFEDHSTALNDHINNAHRFDIEHTPGSSIINIHAKDKDGNKLFTHSLWTKHNSRETDSTTKWLHKSIVPKQKAAKSTKSKAIKEMIDRLFNGDLVESTVNFNSIISDKIKSILESNRREIGKKILNRD